MKKRRHHDVWRKYLRAWSKDELIWCHREGRIFKSNLINIGQIRDFYKLKELSASDIEFIYKLAIERTPPPLRKLNIKWIEIFNLVFKIQHDLEQKGINDAQINKLYDEAIHNIEEDLHEKIESDAIGYIESILNEDIDFYKTDQGYADFTHFLCIQYMRTNKIKSSVLAKVHPTKSIDMEKIWNVLSHILATNMGWNLYAERHLYHMFLLKNRTQKELITGDQPVINTYAKGSQPPKKLEFFYPVSPKLAILITGKPNHNVADEIILKEEDVKKYNLMMIEQSHNQIYAASREVLEELKF
jgi:hypothetical protein